MPHDALLAWFYAHGHPFLQHHVPDGSATLLTDAVRLGASTDEPREFVVCSLGSTGVGKGTLLNAAVAGDRTAVPVGVVAG